MAAVDYGVLKMVDGVFVNMNDSDDFLGYKPIFFENGISVEFYKTNIVFFENGEEKASFWMCDKMDESDEHGRIESLKIEFKDIHMRIKRLKDSDCKFIAKWTTAGHHYQVIFGYGIDPNFYTYKRIRKPKFDGDTTYSYDYNSRIRRTIDDWFKTETLRRKTRKEA